MTKRAAIVFCALSTLMVGTTRSAAAQLPPPREIAFVIDVSAPPLLTPDGKRARGAADRVEAIARGITRLLRTDDKTLPMALSVSPVLCEEMVAMNDARPRLARSRLRDLAARATILSSPHARANLSVLTAAQVRSELERGAKVSRDCIGKESSTTLLPPDLALSTEGVEGAKLAGAEAAISDRVAAPVESDIRLVPGERIDKAETADEFLARSRHLGSTAVVVDGARPEAVGTAVSLAADERIVVRTLDDILADTPPSSVFFPPATQPPARYASALADAAEDVADFASYTLGNNPLRSSLRLGLVRARSTADWADDWSVGVDRAERISALVRAEQNSVTTSQSTVTFTSRRGSVPVTVSNSADYPVRVHVAVASEKLDFGPKSERVVVVEPPGDTITFDATARSSGTFPMRVVISTPDRRVEFDAAELTVRSTAANIPALVLTAGGALFLIGWYGRRAVRRRDREPR